MSVLPNLRHDGRMSRDWTRLPAAIRTARKRLGMTQVELAEAAGVSESTIQNLESRTHSRMPASMPKVERALGWAAGSARAVVDGGEPIPLQEEPAAEVTDLTGTGLPLRVVQEMTEGPLLDATVLDLTPHGSDARMIVVVRGKPDASPEQIRADLLAWEKAQRRLREAGQDDEGHVNEA